MRRLMLCLALVGCGDGGTEPNDEVPRVVGAWCSSAQVTTASKSGDTWNVLVYGNKTEFRDVARPSDGVLVRQEVRSCVSKECHITGAPSTWTADNAVASCRDS